MRKKTTARVMTVILAATIAFSNMTAVTTVYAADEEINVDAGEEYSNSVEQDNAPVEQNNTSADQDNAPAEQTAAEQNNAPAGQNPILQAFLKRSFLKHTSKNKIQQYCHLCL